MHELPQSLPSLLSPFAIFCLSNAECKVSPHYRNTEHSRVPERSHTSVVNRLHDKLSHKCSCKKSGPIRGENGKHLLRMWTKAVQNVNWTGNSLYLLFETGYNSLFLPSSWDCRGFSAPFNGVVNDTDVLAGWAFLLTKHNLVL